MPEDLTIGDEFQGAALSNRKAHWVRLLVVERPGAEAEPDLLQVAGATDSPRLLTRPCKSRRQNDCEQPKYPHHYQQFFPRKTRRPRANSSAIPRPLCPAGTPENSPAFQRWVGLP